MNDFLEFERSQWLFSRRSSTFEDATSLYQSTFAMDNGRVPQLEHARRYVAHWNQMRQENVGLLFWGPPGNGKTFAAACIANGLIEQESNFPPSIRMTTFGIILNKLPALSPADKEYYLNDLKHCDLLILDDFGMERQTDYAREQVFGIIDGQYLAQKTLIVTTNLGLNEMKFTNELAAKRIYDRVLEMCVPVYFSGESLRMAKAAEKLHQLISNPSSGGVERTCSPSSSTNIGNPEYWISEMSPGTGPHTLYPFHLPTHLHEL